MAKFVECDNYVFKLTDKAYKQLLKDIAAGEDVEIGKFGRLIVTNYVKLYDLQKK